MLQTVQNEHISIIIVTNILKRGPVMGKMSIVKDTVIHTSSAQVVKSTPQNLLSPPPDFSKADVLDWNHLVKTMSLLENTSVEFVPHDTAFGIMEIINDIGYHSPTAKTK